MKQQYDSYKPSGIDWIGDIPSHWSVARLKHLIRMKSGDTLSSEQIDPLQGCYPVFGGNGKRGFYSDFNNQGDYVLIGRQGALCGNINYAHEKFWATEHAVVCYPLKSLAILWLGELLRTMNLNQYNVSAAQPGLAVERIKNLSIPVPPLAEQEAIAAWLDERCGEIDAAIAKVDREIELIDELKQSEISRVVTRGLNPDAPLSPSGIDWINEIPINWSSMKLKHTVKNIETDFMDGDWIESSDISTEGIRYLTSGNIGAGIYKEQGDGFITEETFASLNCIEVFPGDLLISRLNEPIARTCLIPELGYRIVTCVDNVIYRPLGNRFDKRYMMYQLNCKPFWFNASQLSSGATMQRISRSKLGAIKVIVPPLSEQQEIADYLDKKCAEIDGLKAKLIKKRETLTELRQSIISEVVTGKRKVI